ncbi:hypothetical protein CVT25_013178 [Psilocybe cyanescens]|uniref:RlpA-like protein double-psi beta-barrel domain-containing protein n=1 Tax=Psilocybe cyanescens TaxID=93625 RepID=A0A409XCV6_PSICY|nr:hypothetical protein CVT25_013178 [Psilocybe cyanescens]
MRLSQAPALLVLSLISIAPVVVAQTHIGTLFNFVPGLGACGHTNTSQQIVATVSNTTFNSFPGATANPNKNPICGHRLLIKGAKNLTITAQIVDYYKTNPTSANNIGLSTVAFTHFAPLADGVIANVTWVIV